MTLLGAALALLSVPGCKKKDSPPPQTPKPTVSPKAPAKVVQNPISSALRLPPPPVTQFDFSTKKDPFKPYVVVKPPPSAAVESARKASQLPIHSYDVSQFKLIGVVTGAKESQAMVTDPAGKGYVLKQGMTIGKNGGRVSAITTKGVEVIEQFRDDNGRVRKEVIRLTLPRKY